MKDLYDLVTVKKEYIVNRSLVYYGYAGKTMMYDDIEVRKPALRVGTYDHEALVVPG